MMAVWMLLFQWECLRCFPPRTPTCLLYRMPATWCPWLNRFCTTWFRMVSERYKNWGRRGRERSAPARAPLRVGSVVWITDSNICPRLYPHSKFGNCVWYLYRTFPVAWKWSKLVSAVGSCSRCSGPAVQAWLPWLSAAARVVGTVTPQTQCHTDPGRACPRNHSSSVEERKVLALFEFSY